MLLQKLWVYFHVHILTNDNVFKVINIAVDGSSDQSWLKSKQVRLGERRGILTLSAPPGPHYREMKIQAGAPLVELIGRPAN